MLGDVTVSSLADGKLVVADENRPASSAAAIPGSAPGSRGGTPQPKPHVFDQPQPIASWHEFFEMAGLGPKKDEVRCGCGHAAVCYAVAIAYPLDPSSVALTTV